METDSQENLIYLKVDDCYLDGISQFRIAIDQMNSSFMDLIYYKKDFKDSCKNIVTINNRFIRELIKTGSLTHDEAFKTIQKYLELTDDNNKKVSKLLEEIKKDIQDKFDDYYESNESPKSESIKEKSELKDDKFDLLKDILDKSRNSIDSDDISDDFMESKIVPLYKDDVYDRYDNDEDDDEDDEANNKRYYGNPFSCVPEEVQKAINKFLSFENSIIAINKILNFNEVTDKYSQKAKTQEDKITKEMQEQKDKAIQAKIDAEKREKERERKKRIQELAEKDIPELETTKNNLIEQKTELENEIDKLKIEKNQLTNDIHNIKEGTESEEDKKDELKNNIQQLKDEQAQITYDIKALKEQKNELKDSIQQLKDEQAQMTYDIKALREQGEGLKNLLEQSKGIEHVLKLLTQLSKIKESYKELKKIYNNNSNK